MGIRIRKDIGYYLPKKNTSKILVKNYLEILEDIDSISHQSLLEIQKDLVNFIKETKSYKFSYASIQLNSLVDEIKSFNINKFIKQIHDYDNYKGLMFQTLELSKISRFDDLIDYYESFKTPSFKINILKEGLYPDNYYICIKNPPLKQSTLDWYAEESTNNPILKIGDILNQDIISYLMIYNGNKNYEDIKEWIYPKESNNKYFHTYINIFCYFLAKHLKIIQPQITWVEFSQQLEPAIIKSWG